MPRRNLRHSEHAWRPSLVAGSGTSRIMRERSTSWVHNLRTRLRYVANTQIRTRAAPSPVARASKLPRCLNDGLLELLLQSIELQDPLTQFRNQVRSIGVAAFIAS